MTALKKALVVLFSVGWLFPLWLACSLFLSFWKVEIHPLLRGETPINSFPFLNVVDQSLAIAFIWLGLAAAWWAGKAIAALQLRQSHPES
jgi:hypothetical protein